MKKARRKKNMAKQNGRVVEGIKLFTLDELSKSLDIHIVTLQRYVREGRILAQKVGKRYLVSQEAPERFLTPEVPQGHTPRQKELFK